MKRSNSGTLKGQTKSSNPNSSFYTPAQSVPKKPPTPSFQVNQCSSQCLPITLPPIKGAIRSKFSVNDEKKFFLLNGLVDLNRDIVMKLIRIIRDKKKARNIIGMTETFYVWTKQRVFRWAMNSLLVPKEFKWSTVFKGKEVEVLDEGKTALLEKYGRNIVTMGDSRIVNGVVKISVKVGMWYGETYSTGYMFGILSRLPRFYNLAPGYEFCGWGLKDDFSVYYEGERMAEAVSRFFDGDLVTMRVDITRGDLEFWINGRKCAELHDVPEIKKGVYVAALLCESHQRCTIVSTEHCAK